MVFPWTSKGSLPHSRLHSIASLFCLCSHLSLSLALGDVLKRTPWTPGFGKVDFLNVYPLLPTHPAIFGKNVCLVFNSYLKQSFHNNRTYFIYFCTGNPAFLVHFLWTKATFANLKKATFPEGVVFFFFRAAMPLPFRNPGGKDMGASPEVCFFLRKKFKLHPQRPSWPLNL